MLSWSAAETSRTIDLAAIVDPETSLGIPGGSELVGLGRAAIADEVDATAVRSVASVIGEAPAVRAAAVAGAFELYNRIVDAAGLPVGRASREAQAATIDTLGLAAFPHAGVGT